MKNKKCCLKKKIFVFLQRFLPLCIMANFKAGGCRQVLASFLNRCSSETTIWGYTHARTRVRLPTFLWRAMCKLYAVLRNGFGGFTVLNLNPILFITVTLDVLISKMEKLCHIVLGVIRDKAPIPGACLTVRFQWEVIPFHLPLLIIYHILLLLKAAIDTGFYKSPSFSNPTWPHSKYMNKTGAESMQFSENVLIRQWAI